MLVLHVGPHKTATTWLQVNFHHNHNALLRQGWLYPLTGERVRVAHHDLSDDPDQILDPKSRKVREFQKIARKSAGENLNVLLSSEGFSNWKPAHLKALQEIMRGHELHVVYALRDPVSRFYSFWAQKVKTGSSTSLPAYRKKHFRRPGQSGLLNPLIDIRQLAALPDTRLTLLLYEDIRRRKLDIFDVFVTEVLKLPILPHVAESTANERQTIEMTEFMRLLLKRIGQKASRGQVKIGRVFHYMLTGGKKKAVIQAVAAVGKARHTMTVKRDPVFYDEIEQGLMAYRDRMIPVPEDGRLFPTGPEEFEYYDSAMLESDPAVSRLLDEMQVKFRPGSLRIRLINLARGRLMSWRRFVKLFR